MAARTRFPLNRRPRQSARLCSPPAPDSLCQTPGFLWRLPSRGKMGNVRRREAAPTPLPTLPYRPNDPHSLTPCAPVCRIAVHSLYRGTLTQLLVLTCRNSRGVPCLILLYWVFVRCP